MAKAVLLDLSGVVYQGSAVVPGAAEAIARLKARGIPVRFLTNTTRTPKRLIITQLHEMGVAATDAEIFTPARSACDWLAQHDFSPYLLVHNNLREDFESCKPGPRQAVIVGDAGSGFTYEALNAAFRKLTAGAPFIALARNRTFLDMDDKLSLDAGAFVAALEFASRRKALVLGKPSPEFFHIAAASMNCLPEDTVMVGDDAEADIAGALAAGIGAGLLVRTGKYQPSDEKLVTPTPTAVLDDLPEAIDWLLG